MQIQLTENEYTFIAAVLRQVAVAGEKDVETLSGLFKKFEVKVDNSSIAGVPDKR